MASSPAPSYIPMMSVPSPAPVPKQDDEAVKEAQRKQLALERSLQGRGATLMAGGAQPDPTQRAGARLLGNFGALG